MLTDATFVRDELVTGYLVFGSLNQQQPCGSSANPVRIDPADGSVEFRGQAVVSSPAAHDADDDVEVQVLENIGSPAVTVVATAADGTSWTGAIPGNLGDRIDVAPTARGGRVHVADDDLLHAFPLAGCATGPCSPDWSTDLGDTITAVVDSFPGPLYATVGSNLLVVDRANGQVAGSTALTGTVRGIAATDDTVYVAAGQTLSAFRQGNTLLWSATLAGNAASNLALAGGVVYVGESGGVEMFPAEGCGEPTCGRLSSVSVVGAASQLSVADGRLFVVHSVAADHSELSMYARP